MRHTHPYATPFSYLKGVLSRKNRYDLQAKKWGNNHYVIHSTAQLQLIRTWQFFFKDTGVTEISDWNWIFCALSYCANISNVMTSTYKTLFAENRSRRMRPVLTKGAWSRWGWLCDTNYRQTSEARPLCHPLSCPTSNDQDFSLFQDTGLIVCFIA